MSVIAYVSRVASCALFVGLVLSGCASRSTEPQPPEIAYGQDLCEACGMIIGDARFAAAILTADGQAHKFDDIGEMLGYDHEHPGEQVRARFVHDYHSETWLRAEAAFYVTGPEIASPMGHGIAAFEARAEAEVFARARGADVQTFDDMQAEGRSAHP